MTSKPKFDVYQTITDQIIEALEAGVKPWINSWLKALRNEKRFIVSAASKAQAAANYIHERATASKAEAA